jgi:hypothetical protein
VAVGDERAHAAGLGECEFVEIVRLAEVGVEPVGMHGDVAEQTQRKSSRSAESAKVSAQASAQELVPASEVSQKFS